MLPIITKMIEINFVRDEKYKGIIEDGYEAADIIKNISLIDPTKKFVPEKTLIFFFSSYSYVI